MWTTPDDIAPHLYSGFGDSAAHGGRPQWLLGLDGSVRALSSVATSSHGPSQLSRPIDDGPHLTFYVSADLESVVVTVRWANSVWHSERAYGRALLALARARLKDRVDAALRPHEQGWVHAEDVIRLADYDDIGRLNVEVHRARADFSRNKTPGGSDIVQRRRGTGQLRLGVDRIEVVDARR